jgi:hypothetical protein
MFWFVPYRFPYEASIGDPSQQLLQTLQQEKWQRISHTASATHIKLQHRLPLFFYNSWNPIFAGSFVTEGGRRFLVGYFRINWLVFALIIIFLAQIGYELWSIYHAPASRPGYVANWKEMQWRWELSFLGMFLAINAVGWLIGVPYERRILAAIRESTVS